MKPLRTGRARGMSLGLALALWAAASLPAAAGASEDIGALRLQMQKQQAELDQMRARLAELERAQAATAPAATAAAPTAPPPAPAPAPATNADTPAWSQPYGRPLLSSADGRNTFAVRALAQADYAHYAQDPAGPPLLDFRRGSTGSTIPNRENQSARDLSDGAYFRRARLGFEGTIERDFAYRFIMEFGGNGTEGPARINDAWVAYNGLAPFSFQLGAGAPPANMDDGTSPEDQWFIERATGAELSRALGGADGRTGALVRASGPRWMGSLALTGRTVNDAEVSDSQSAWVARAARLLVSGSDYNLHAGASGTWVVHPADAGLDATGARYGIRLRNQPELRVDSTRLIDSGAINADHAYAAGLELAGQWRALTLQAERFWYGIDRYGNSTANPRFSSWYAEGSWILTGERRRYNAASGSYQNPRPFIQALSGGGTGAWELALRYSHADLDYMAGAPGAALPKGGVRGGVQDIWTFGVNWYLNANLKMLLDYLSIDVNRLSPGGTAFGDGFTPPAGAQVGQRLSAWALRTQLTY